MGQGGRVTKTVRIDLTVILTILFIIFKMTGVINWSWIWVLSPLWFTFAVFLCFICFMIVFPFIFAIIIDLVKRIREK